MTFVVQLIPVLSISKNHYANKETYLSVVKNFCKQQLVKKLLQTTLKHLLHKLVQVPQYAFKKGES